jgi:thymidylate synthase (FAD)
MIKVGNNGFVTLIDAMGSDLTVVNAARVSFNKISKWEEDIEAEQDGYVDIAYKLNDKDKKLISYLAKHKHWTPFAHPQITLHIKAPMPIRTQFFKHKVGFVENEISRRYVDEPPEFFSPSWSSRPNGSMKQGSGDKLSDDARNRAQYIYWLAIDAANSAYKDLLQLGVAPEQARFVLPQATYTEWYWTGSLAAYARFYKQRSDLHAQAEIREYADAIGNIIQPLYSVSWEALTNSSVTPE